MGGAIGKVQRKVSPTGTRVVECRSVTSHSHGNWQGRNLDDVDQDIQVTCETDVGAAIN
jgi:hypothetical protein